MGKRFSVVFNPHNAERIERMAARLGVQPVSLLCGFLLEKLTELEQLREGNTINRKEIRTVNGYSSRN